MPKGVSGCLALLLLAFAFVFGRLPSVPAHMQRIAKARVRWRLLFLIRVWQATRKLLEPCKTGGLLPKGQRCCFHRQSSPRSQRESPQAACQRWGPCSTEGLPKRSCCFQGAAASRQGVHEVQDLGRGGQSLRLPGILFPRALLASLRDNAPEFHIPDAVGMRVFDATAGRNDVLDLLPEIKQNLTHACQ